MKKKDLIQALKMALYDLEHGIPVKIILDELGYALFDLNPPEAPAEKESESQVNEKRLQLNVQRIIHNPGPDRDPILLMPEELVELATALLAAQKRVAELEEENQKLQKAVDVLGKTVLESGEV